MKNKSFKKLNFILVGLFILTVFSFAGILSAEKASADCLISSTLRAGNNNNQVLCLQSKIGLVADGKFGPLTLSAVKAFQMKNGLTPDGVVGPKTISALGMGNAISSAPGTLCPNGKTMVSNCTTLPGNASLEEKPSGLKSLCDNSVTSNTAVSNVCSKIAQLPSQTPSSPSSPTPPVPLNPPTVPGDNLQLTIGNVSTSGTTATVPIVANNFTNIGGYEFRFKYDPSIAKQVSFEFVLGGLFTFAECAHGYCHGSWISVPSVTIPDGTTIMNMHFEEISDGVSPFTFINRYGNYNENNYYIHDSQNPGSPLIVGEIDGLNGSLTFQTPVRPHLNISAPKLTIQPVSVPSSYPPATTVSVPITVENFNDVKLMYLKIHFDEDLLGFGILNQFNNPVNGAQFNDEILALVNNNTPEGGKARCANYSNPNGIYSAGDIFCEFYTSNENNFASLPNGATLLTLNFHRKTSDPINTNITFINDIDDPLLPYNSEFFNSDYYRLIDMPTANHYVDGSVAFQSMPLPPPIANPPYGLQNTSPITVILSHPTSDVLIYYTLDNSTPTTSSTLYTSPITISSSGRLNAIAVKSGMTNSHIMSVYYTLPTVAIPTVTPTSGFYSNPLTVTISTTTLDAIIYYTTDGSIPTTSSTMYTSPFIFSTSGYTVLKAIAVKSGMADSAVRTMYYTINTNPGGQVATPYASPSGGAYTTSQTVALSTSTSDANIYYTTNGTTPTTSSTMYTSPIIISSTTTLKAIAVKSGMTNSAVMTQSYTINTNPTQVATPYASPSGGTYTFPQAIALSTSTSDANIYYTTNGTTPTTSSTMYTSPIIISSTTTLKAIAVKSGMTNSAVMTQSYTINTNPGGQVATPIASLPSGTYTSPITVTLSTTTSDAEIHYRTDGWTPTISDPLYTGPITISVTTPLKVKAFKAGMTDSESIYKSYTINGNINVATPIPTPYGGTYYSPQTVSLFTSTEGDTIYYTIDGSTPTTSSPIYTSPITISTTTLLKAFAAKLGMGNSGIIGQLYTIN